LVDSTDLIIITSVAQTIVITATLAVFIFQFRSQEKATKEASYQSLMGRYNDYIRMLVEKPELAKLLDFSEGDQSPAAKPEKLSPEDEVISAYLLMGYGMFEEVYLLYKKKWIDEDNWEQWSAFLQRMAKQPLFRRIHRGTRGTFDKEFQDYVSKLIEEV
jgi:hypothetical protein